MQQWLVWQGFTFHSSLQGTCPHDCTKAVAPHRAHSCTADNTFCSLMQLQHQMHAGRHSQGFSQPRRASLTQHSRCVSSQESQFCVRVTTGCIKPLIQCIHPRWFLRTCDLREQSVSASIVLSRIGGCSDLSTTASSDRLNRLVVLKVWCRYIRYCCGLCLATTANELGREQQHKQPGGCLDPTVHKYADVVLNCLWFLLCLLECDMLMVVACQAGVCKGDQQQQNH